MRSNIHVQNIYEYDTDSTPDFSVAHIMANVISFSFLLALVCHCNWPLGQGFLTLRIDKRQQDIHSW